MTWTLTFDLGDKSDTWVRLSMVSSIYIIDIGMLFELFLIFDVLV